MVRITVRRPSGEIETSDKETIYGMNPVLWSQICQATRQAGLGECIGYAVNGGEYINGCYPVPPIKRSEATIERLRISRLFEKSESLRDYPGACVKTRMAAEKALAEWKVNYPEAVKAERKSNLLTSAENTKRKASDALCFDADGWLDEAERQKRHDEYMAQAESMTAEANKL